METMVENAVADVENDKDVALTLDELVKKDHLSLQDYLICYQVIALYVHLNHLQYQQHNHIYNHTIIVLL